MFILSPSMLSYTGAITMSTCGSKLVEKNKITKNVHSTLILAYLMAHSTFFFLSPHFSLKPIILNSWELAHSRGKYQKTICTKSTCALSFSPLPTAEHLSSPLSLLCSQSSVHRSTLEINILSSSSPPYGKSDGRLRCEVLIDWLCVLKTKPKCQGLKWHFWSQSLSFRLYLTPVQLETESKEHGAVIATTSKANQWRAGDEFRLWETIIQ